MSRLERSFRSAIYGLSITLIALAFVGGWLWYSPIPYLDMWDGTVGYLIRSDGFPPNGVFDQHNEHRIALTRLLFWLDYNLFGGRHIFLILFNYACAVAAWWVFWSCLKEINSDTVRKEDLNLVGMILGAWVFLWTQAENFTWAFQSQFFLTQLLPLGAFLLLSRSAHVGERPYLTFGLAIIMGSLSAITMANGVLALPLMALWAIVLRLPIWRVLALGVASAIILGLYLTDYVSPSHHSSLLESVLSDPLGVLAFTFRYLASPFAHIISPYPPASFIILALGLTITVFAMLRTYKTIQKRPENAVAAGLLLFIIYIGASAFLTAGGRIIFAEYAAFARRYTTPAVLAWAAAFCLASPWVFRLFYQSKTVSLRVLGFAVLGLIALFVPIVRTLVPPANTHFNQSLAVLALELGVDDPDQIGHVYPHSAPALIVAERATQRDFGIFGRAPYQGLRELVGQTTDSSNTKACRSNEIDASIALEQSPNFVRVSGEISHLTTKARGSRVLILSEDKTVLGAGLIDHPRSTVDSTNKKVRTAAFVAYLKADTLEQPLTLMSNACR